MTQFDMLMPLVFDNEGVGARFSSNPTGLVKLPGEGFWTNWGVTQKTWDDLRLKEAYYGFPPIVQDLTMAQAMLIYHHEYYDAINGDSFPPGPAYVLFDAAVNQGVGTARRIGQRAVGVADDGEWGPISLGALKRASRDIPRFIENLCWERVREYAHDTKQKGKDSEFPWYFSTVWVPRVLKVRQAAQVMGAT